MAPETSAQSPTDEPRFAFGENWSSYAAQMSPERIEAARRSLTEMLGDEVLDGARFLDIGSGSGIFSLAATSLGAKRVHSLDYDEASVETTARLKREFAPGAEWKVERADVLDSGHIESLGEWDVVYSWGVLHHTGEMWRAAEIACARVRPGGRLFIAIYNDQGAKSRLWHRIKRLYQRLPHAARKPYAYAVMLPLELRSMLGYAARGRLTAYFREWSSSATYSVRGMNRRHDIFDWVGGYPFEFAAPEEIIEFCSQRGFTLIKLVTVGGSHGCNEFVFERAGSK